MGFLPVAADHVVRSETVDLDSLWVHLQSSLSIDQKVLHSITLIPLQLYDISSFLVLHNSSIASELFLDHLQDLLEVELGRDAFDCCQSFTSVTLLDTDVDVCDNVESAERSWGNKLQREQDPTYETECSFELCRLCPGLAHPRRDL